MIQEDLNNKFKIYPLTVLADNIVWIWVFKDKAIVIDPSIAKPVKAWLKEKQLQLLAILQTHHHEDHIGGTEELISQWPEADVIASKADLNRIPFQTISVKDRDTINVMGYPITILGIPGHTSTHIAFHLRDKTKTSSVLFCGDTLFSGGCGRLLEGTPKDMFLSLKRINMLPSHTKIYCGHEYTEANLKWANSLYPNDLLIKKCLQETIQIRKLGKTTLPSSIEEERKINLFLRAKNIEELAYLRKNKDNWPG